MIASTLIAASSAIIFALGAVHLVYTFRGPKLTPRDAALQTAMRAVSPVLTRETTMWNAWVGFNASHSLGAILFGLVYGYLALVHAAFLFESAFLLTLGFAMLAIYVVLARLYWFRVPFRGIGLALILYSAGVVLGLFSAV
jgi:hypothetical protein